MNLSKQQLDELERDYKAGAISVNALAKRFCLSEPTLRRFIKKQGWVRAAPETKRRIVSDAMAGVTKGLTNDELRQSQELAAFEDIQDMERGIRIGRMCLLSLEQSAMTAAEPKEVKTIIEAASSAIDTIRRIRGLDEGANKPRGPTDDDDARAESIAGRLEARIAPAAA